MKSRNFHSFQRSGFTLVELLVVIAIIAILASVLLVGVSQALTTAKRARTSSMANQILTAVQSFYTEYSAYPVDTTAAGLDTYYSNAPAGAGSSWSKMTMTLYGNINPALPNSGVQTTGMFLDSSNVPVNSRNIPYISVSRADLDTTGAAANAPAIKTPFKNPDTGGPEYYFMAIDTNYDNVVGDKDQAAGKLPDFSTAQPNAQLKASAGIATGVAVWSNCDQSTTGNTTPNFWVHTY